MTTTATSPSVTTAPEGWTIYDEHSHPATSGAYADAGTEATVQPVYEPTNDGLKVRVEAGDYDRQGVLDLIDTLKQSLELADAAHQSHSWPWARYEDAQ